MSAWCSRVIVGGGVVGRVSGWWVVFVLGTEDYAHRSVRYYMLLGSAMVTMVSVGSVASVLLCSITCVRGDG